MKRLIIFDWAGTLVDNGSKAPLRAFLSTFEKTYSKYKIYRTPEQINRYMGMDKMSHLNELTKNEQISKELYPLLLQTMKMEVFNHSRPIPGVPYLLQYLLTKRYYIGSTSGYSRELLNIAISRSQLEGMYIPYHVASDEVTKSRPFPDMILRNANYFGLHTYQTSLVKIGDTTIDIEEGSSCRPYFKSVDIIGIADSKEKKEKMLEKGASFVVDDIRQVLQIL